ncbi:hypothetical protein JCM10213_002998 [Rhodosporidiobolus nylandii]
MTARQDLLNLLDALPRHASAPARLLADYISTHSLASLCRELPAVVQAYAERTHGLGILAILARANELRLSAQRQAALATGQAWASAKEVEQGKWGDIADELAACTELRASYAPATVRKGAVGVNNVRDSAGVGELHEIAWGDQAALTQALLVELGQTAQQLFAGENGAQRQKQAAVKEKLEQIAIKAGQDASRHGLQEGWSTASWRRARRVFEDEQKSDGQSGSSDGRKKVPPTWSRKHPKPPKKVAQPVTTLSESSSSSRSSSPATHDSETRSDGHGGTAPESAQGRKKKRRGISRVVKTPVTTAQHPTHLSSAPPSLPAVLLSSPIGATPTPSPHISPLFNPPDEGDPSGSAAGDGYGGGMDLNLADWDVEMGDGWEDAVLGVEQAGLAGGVQSEAIGPNDFPLLSSRSPSPHRITADTLRSSSSSPSRTSSSSSAGSTPPLPSASLFRAPPPSSAISAARGLRFQPLCPDALTLESAAEDAPALTDEQRQSLRLQPRAEELAELDQLDAAQLRELAVRYQELHAVQAAGALEELDEDELRAQVAAYRERDVAWRSAVLDQRVHADIAKQHSRKLERRIAQLERDLDEVCADKEQLEEDQRDREQYDALRVRHESFAEQQVTRLRRERDRLAAQLAASIPSSAAPTPTSAVPRSDLIAPPPPAFSAPGSSSPAAQSAPPKVPLYPITPAAYGQLARDMVVERRARAESAAAAERSTQRINELERELGGLRKAHQHAFSVFAQQKAAREQAEAALRQEQQSNNYLRNLLSANGILP